MTLIASIDPNLRRIYLHADTVGASIHPIDIYKEMRTLRRIDETLRPYDVFMTSSGHEAKDLIGVKYTERLVKLLLGTRIVPFDTDHELVVTGSIISDDGYEGVGCFDRSPLNASTQVDITYEPKQVEVIEINTGSAVTQQDKDDIISGVWAAVDRTLTSGGGGGLTAQEIWEYTTRELSTDIPSATVIAAAVWSATVRALSETVVLSSSDIDAIAAAVRVNLDTELGRIDTTISSRYNGQSVIGVNVKEVNDTEVKGTGTDNDPWGPV